MMRKIKPMIGLLLMVSLVALSPSVEAQKTSPLAPTITITSVKIVPPAGICTGVENDCIEVGAKLSNMPPDPVEYRVDIKVTYEAGTNSGTRTVKDISPVSQNFLARVEVFHGSGGAKSYDVTITALSTTSASRAPRVIATAQKSGNF